jgi:hypothetical protein
MNTPKHKGAQEGAQCPSGDYPVRTNVHKTLLSRYILTTCKSAEHFSIHLMAARSLDIQKNDMTSSHPRQNL